MKLNFMDKRVDFVPTKVFSPRKIWLNLLPHLKVHPSRLTPDRTLESHPLGAICRKTMRTAEYLYRIRQQKYNLGNRLAYAAAAARLSKGFATVVTDNNEMNNTMNNVMIPSR